MQYSSDIKKSESKQLININNCGELRVDSDSHIRRYAGRNDYQLIYICEGHCVVTINETVHIAYPGDCILYRPGETQDYLLSQKAQPRTYWIHFNGDACQKMIETLSLQNICLVKTAQNREIEHLVSRVCKHYNLNTPNREWICSGLMQCVLALLSNEVQENNLTGGGKGYDKISE